MPRHGIAIADINRSIEVRVKAETARGTAKIMTTALPQKATAGAYLTGIGGVNFRHYQRELLGLALGIAPYHAMLPLRKPTSQGLAPDLPLAGLGHVQCLEDQHGIGSGPLAKALGGGLGECPRAIRPLASEPFEGTTDTVCILTLCLAGRKLLLKLLAGLIRTFVSDFYIPARDKKVVPFSIHSYQGIGFIEIDADRVDALGIGIFQGKGNTPQEKAIPFNNRQGVDLLGLLEDALESFGDFIEDALAPSYSPDGQATVFAEVGISAALADQEHGSFAVEAERLIDSVLVSLGGSISTSHQAQGSNSHLGVKSAFDDMVTGPLQGHGPQGPTLIEGDGGSLLFDLSEGIESGPQVGIAGQKDGDSALNLYHRVTIPHPGSIDNFFDGRRQVQFLSPVNGGAPLRYLCGSNINRPSWHVALWLYGWHDATCRHRPEPY